MSLTVVVTTYGWPEALTAVLNALARQSDTSFDIVVADDGSGPTTCDAVESCRTLLGDRLQYVHQPDRGFRVARVRNLGALAARGDYLVFVDGDCVPGRHFVRALKSAAVPGWFVAFRRVELGAAWSERVLSGEIDATRRTRLRWMIALGRATSDLSAFTSIDRRRVGRTGVPEFEPSNRSYGRVGVARSDLERANGFDMRFVGWGEEDVDLAVRLRRLGLRCGHAGPHATLLHLWHERRRSAARPNWELLEDTTRSERVEAVEGLRELRASLARETPAAGIDSAA